MGAVFRHLGSIRLPSLHLVYKSKLRKLLQTETAEFWDMNTHLFRDNFMYAGTSGLMAKILCAPLWLAGVHKRMVHGEDVGGERGGFFFWFTMKMRPSLRSGLGLPR